MKNLIFQIKQFFMAFPAPGSWAYRFEVWKYDRRMDDIRTEIGKNLQEEMDQLLKETLMINDIVQVDVSVDFPEEIRKLMREMENERNDSISDFKIIIGNSERWRYLGSPYSSILPANLDVFPDGFTPWDLDGRDPPGSDGPGDGEDTKPGSS